MDDTESLARTNMLLGWPVLDPEELLEPAQPVPLGDCGHPAWGCACTKHRQPIESDEDPTVQHEPTIQEGY